MKIVKLFKILGDNFYTHSYLLLLLMFLGSVLEMLGLSLIVPLLTLITDFENSNKYLEIIKSIFNFREKTNFESIFLLCILMAAVYLLKNLILLFINFFQLNFVKKFNVKLGYLLFKKYLSNDYKYFFGKNSSIFIRNLSTDLNLLSSSIISYALIMLESLIAFSIIILLFLYNFIATLVIILVFVSIIFLYLSISKQKLESWAKERQKSENNKVKILKEALTFIKEIKLYKINNYFSDIFDTANKKLSITMFKHLYLQTSVRLLLEVVTILLVLISIIFLSYNKDINNIIPTIALYVASAFKLIPSLNRIITSYQQIRFVRPILDNFLNEFKKTKGEENKTDNICKDTGFTNSIEIKNVDYSHENRDPIFRNLNVKINKGSFTAIIGDSGIGKSTFIDLLSGFITPDGGSIMIDNNYDIKNNLNSWQNNIAYTPQNIIILNSSIINNIIVGRDMQSVDQNKLNQAIFISGLENLIKELPYGHNTELGELGNNLSGGQKQRLGIARAIYKDKKILFFDEATNALDDQMNNLILSRIKNYSDKENKTVIFVSHDNSIKKYANEIIDLNNL